MPPPLFTALLLHWFHQHGRKTLPWQEDIHPYRVWVSEIMLQQTQVKTVIPYFERFMQRFPDLASLAAATQEEVLFYWAGLGYYARGRNLHHAAQKIMRDYGGCFPQELAALQSLPGLGRSTASAILAICNGQRLPILDGNVKRVLSRYFGISGYPGDKKVEALLWQKAADLLPHADIPAYTQAIMDLGALICLPRNPQCCKCPVQKDCFALQHQQTSTLPTAKPKKAYPTKEAYFALILQDDKLLLEKRPPKGIWGGLWCPPEFDTKAELTTFLQGYPATASETRTHLFTHYRLLFTPYWAKVDTQFCHDKNQVWIPMSNLGSQPVARPIQILLHAAPLLQKKMSL